MCIFIVAKVQERKNQNRRPYAFSLLRDGNSFFDDDEKEIEVFKRPSKGILHYLKTKKKKKYIFIF